MLTWTSHLAQVRLLQPGYSTGYGRRFIASEPTWIGIVPVGYGDGFRRDLTGTEVRVGGEMRRVVGTVSMDAFAVELEAELPVGTPVVIVGRGVLAERHAEVADTITYELVCGINNNPERARRVVVAACPLRPSRRPARGASGSAGGRARRGGADVRAAGR